MSDSREPVTSAVTVAVVGDRRAGLEPQDRIEPALQDAANLSHVAVRVEWHATEAVARDPDGRLATADAVWCAPGGPFASLDGALAGIRFARESGRPFLGTCAGFQLCVVEFARNVLGLKTARHAEYPGDERGPVLIDELLCSLTGRTMPIALTDAETQAIYAGEHAEERYYCRFGLNEDYAGQLGAAGLRVAAVDRTDGATRIVRLAGHPFFYATLFVPQVASTPARPHPLIARYLAAAAERKRTRVAAEA